MIQDCISESSLKTVIGNCCYSTPRLQSTNYNMPKCSGLINSKISTSLFFLLFYIVSMTLKLQLTISRII